MKKILITVLSLLMALSMFGCKKEKSTESLVNDAIEKTLKIDSYSFNGSLYNTVEIMGYKITEGSEYTYKAQNLRSNEEYIGNLDLYLGNAPVKLNVYSNKNSIYIDDGSYKRFMPYDSPDINAVKLNYLVMTFLKKLPERALKEAVVSEKEDGSKVITVLLNDDETMTVYKDYFEAQSSAEKGLKCTGTGYKADITISKDGYVMEFIGTFRGIYTDISISGENADASYETDTEVILTFINPGEKVTFDAPDVSDYLDASKFNG